jgi:hypothetical protein
VLRWFARPGPLDPADAQDMAAWHHGGGFSLDASIRIEGPDRSGLESKAGRELQIPLSRQPRRVAFFNVLSKITQRIE